MSPYRTLGKNTEPQPKTPRRPLSGLAKSVLWACAGSTLSCWPIYGWVAGWLDTVQAFWCFYPAIIFVLIVSGLLAAHGFFKD